MTRDRSARPRGPALGCARGSWAIRPERNGIGDVERMSRRTVLIDSQRVRVGYGAQRGPVLSPIGSLPPPANHDDVGLYVPEIARIFRAYGIGDGAQRRGMDGPEPEQVQQHQAGVPPSSRKTDATTQSRILCAFGSRGGIKQDESGSAAAAPPCAPQGVTVSTVRGIVGGGPDVRGHNGIHNETGSEAAIRTAQRTPARSGRSEKIRQGQLYYERRARIPCAAAAQAHATLACGWRSRANRIRWHQQGLDGSRSKLRPSPARLGLPVRERL